MTVNYRFIFSYLPFVSAGVAFLLYVLPCRYRVRAQAWWLMALLLCAAKFLAFEAFGGHVFNPELPEAVIWSWNFLYSGMTILAGISLPGLLVPRRFRRVALPVLAWAASAWGMWCGIRPPDVREVALEFADLPAALDGYRIAQISDTHVSASARRWRTEAIVELANAAKPDLVCITGDLVDGAFRHRAGDVEPLSRLSAPDGVWACSGNHEFYGEDWLRWREAFADWNIRFLRNACATPRPGLALGGVDDEACGRREARPDVARAFAEAPEGAFRVLLQHRPKNAPANVAAAKVRLQLSGHTHGGITPPLARIVASVNGGFVRGLYDLGNGALLCVSPGTGQWAGFPIRLFNNSEITVFTLRRKKP